MSGFTRKMFALRKTGSRGSSTSSTSSSSTTTTTSSTTNRGGRGKRERTHPHSGGRTSNNRGRGGRGYNRGPSSQRPSFLQRKYTHNSKTNPSTTPANANLRLMTYNVLAQNLLDEHHHLYRRTPGYMLDWDFRFRNLSHDIKTAKPTILCLQEVQDDHLTSHWIPFLHSLGLELAGYMCRGPSADGVPRTDGCAMFYDCRRVTKLFHQNISLYQPDNPVLDRKNVAVTSCFQMNDGGEGTPPVTFVCTTTHLVFNCKRGDVKAAQMQLVLNATKDMVSAVAQSFALEATKIPTIVCGDFNATPGSALMHMCKESKVTVNSNEIPILSGQWQYQSRSCKTVDVGRNSYGPEQLCTETPYVYVNDVKQPPDGVPTLKEGQKKPNKQKRAAKKENEILELAHSMGCLKSAYAEVHAGTVELAGISGRDGRSHRGNGRHHHHNRNNNNNGGHGGGGNNNGNGACLVSKHCLATSVTIDIYLLIFLFFFFDHIICILHL